MLKEVTSSVHEKWKEITFNDQKWTYLIIESNKETEETVLLLPGGLRRPVYGGEFMKALSEEFTVLIPVYPQISDMKVLTDGIQQIMEVEGINSAHLFGSSFGGLMTQAFLYYYPDKVEKAIIGNSGTISDDEGFEKRVKKSLFLIKIFPAFIVRRVMIRAFTRLVPKDINNRGEIVKSIEDLIKTKQLDKKDILCHFESLLYFQNKLGLTKEFANTIQEKLLIITAENDRGVTSNAAESLKKMYPKAQYHYFSEGGHMPMLANPKKYIELVKNFYK
jgi:pimeloyl-ACP methyl ester carboxylesterase